MGAAGVGARRYRPAMAIKDDVAKVRRLSNDIQMMAQSAQGTHQPADPVALAFAASDALRQLVAMIEELKRRVELMESERRLR
jgi:hypothetical protein